MGATNLETTFSRLYLEVQLRTFGRAKGKNRVSAKIFEVDFFANLAYLDPKLDFSIKVCIFLIEYQHN